MSALVLQSATNLQPGFSSTISPSLSPLPPPFWCHSHQPFSSNGSFNFRFLRVILVVPLLWGCISQPVFHSALPAAVQSRLSDPSPSHFNSPIPVNSPSLSFQQILIYHFVHFLLRSQFSIPPINRIIFSPSLLASPSNQLYLSLPLLCCIVYLLSVLSLCLCLCLRLSLALCAALPFPRLDIVSPPLPFLRE